MNNVQSIDTSSYGVFGFKIGSHTEKTGSFIVAKLEELCLLLG